MNKYLEKIADEESQSKLKAGLLGTYAGAMGLNYGTEYAGRALDSGDVTGRLGLYHGTSAERAEQIRQTGLRPGAAQGILDITEETNNIPRGNMGAGKLVFTTMNPHDAMTYAVQQEYLQGRDLKGDAARKFMTGDDGARVQMENRTNRIPGALARVHSPNVLKLSVPENHGIPLVENPEFAQVKKDPMWRLTPWKEKFVREGLRDHRVFQGEVPTEYIKGSANYKGLTMGELVQHVRNNPGRFAKGAGKVLLGTTAAVGAAPATYAMVRYGDSLAKQATEQYQMPLSKAIEEHKRLVDVLRSNNRKLELRELEDQGDELKEMRKR